MRALLSASMLLFAQTSSADPVEYTVILVGNEAGTMIVDEAPGRASMTFSFNDRGRGPDISSEYQLNEAGFPIALSVTGVDYMKAAVDESLRVEDGVWTWKSAADSGSSERPGFYSTLDGPPGELTLLVRALLASENREIDMLPQGHARLEVVSEITLESGEILRQAEIHGLGFEPSPLWLDESDAMFALVSGWFSLVPKGRTDIVEDLQAAQDERRNARFREIAKAASVSPIGTVVIDKARIFDVVTKEVMTANGVVVVDGIIEQLLEPGAPRPAGAMIIDAAGRTLLPGLWDMHTHLDLADGALHLAAGVTTVRDLANDHDQLMEIIRAIDDGDTVGPHVFRAGFIDGTGPFAGPTKARIETQADAEKWIDFYAETGYDQIKIYSSIPIELVPMMAARAHAAGMRFSGHIPAGMWAEDAVRAGFDEIQHINMIFLNFYKDIVETRNPDRFIKVAERGADLDPESAPFQAFVQLLLENGTVIDPTVAVFMDLFVHEPGQLAPSLQSAEGRLPPEVRRGNLKGGLSVPAGWEERYQASAQQMLKVIAALHAAGVPLVAGTDGLAGFTLQAELAYYQEAGISAADILQLATSGSAAVMGVADKVGHIAPGLRADLILVDGQPDQDIRAITQVSWVMKAGDIIDPAMLYRAMSIQPATTMQR